MDLFATLYERWLDIYNLDYYLIFLCFYDEGTYTMSGLALLVFPLLLWILFYKAWKYPYGKIIHWVVWLIIVSIIVGVATYFIYDIKLNSATCSELFEALNDPDTGYIVFAKTLPLKYAIYNSLLALAISFLFSLILKRFSKLQTHLPF